MSGPELAQGPAGPLERSFDVGFVPVLESWPFFGGVDRHTESVHDDRADRQDDRAVNVRQGSAAWLNGASSKKEMKKHKASGTLTATYRGREAVNVSDLNLDRFQDRVELLIRLHGSAAEVARLCGVSESVLRKWRGGESDPSRSHLVALALGTGASIQWLATGEGETPGALLAKEPGGTYGAALDRLKEVNAFVVQTAEAAGYELPHYLGGALVELILQNALTREGAKRLIGALAYMHQREERGEGRQ